MNTIIGTSGTNGSGKDTVGAMLVERHGYLFVSVSDLLREEARKRGLPVTREVLRTISAEWRREHGVGVLVDKALDLYDSQKQKYKGVVISPMRNTGEAQHLKDKGGLLIWTDADPRLRYERIQSNAQARGRAGEDQKTFEEFLEEEEAEMTHSGDEATLNMAGVKKLADIEIVNNVHDIDVFKDEAESVLLAYAP